MEGALLLVKAFPVFMIASPSFVGTLSAYCAARAADLSWGNRPAASPEEQVRRRLALKLPDDDALIRDGTEATCDGCILLNALLVAANLALMAAAPWLVTAIAFVHPSPLFEGAIELCLVLSFAFLHSCSGCSFTRGRLRRTVLRGLSHVTARSPQPKGGSCASGTDESGDSSGATEWRLSAALQAAPPPLPS
eukprot:CAMPEP_0202770630 /NCGR_PEP_ID=MMETSP1388-20130828/39241_1 /ASSEMBLY_ACC=CAM_ASM_000864 /TAXON_ID=37098 /ORGANISM="Isochrysis sp, Strain CCMP1244" /LENGTH=192 /DNA_ID=CAMNT_0049439483 /DNA_START=50 /DNA_END=625 /DNA_ORIENTATION=+